MEDEDFAAILDAPALPPFTVKETAYADKVVIREHRGRPGILTEVVRGMTRMLSAVELLDATDAESPWGPARSVVDAKSHADAIEAALEVDATFTGQPSPEGTNAHVWHMREVLLRGMQCCGVMMELEKRDMLGPDDFSTDVIEGWLKDELLGWYNFICSCPNSRSCTSPTAGGSGWSVSAKRQLGRLVQSMRAMRNNPGDITKGSAPKWPVTLRSIGIRLFKCAVTAYNAALVPAKARSSQPPAPSRLRKVWVEVYERVKVLEPYVDVAASLGFDSFDEYEDFIVASVEDVTKVESCKLDSPLQRLWHHDTDVDYGLAAWYMVNKLQTSSGLGLSSNAQAEWHWLNVLPTCFAMFMAVHYDGISGVFRRGSACAEVSGIVDVATGGRGTPASLRTPRERDSDRVQNTMPAPDTESLAPIGERLGLLIQTISEASRTSAEARVREAQVRAEEAEARARTTAEARVKEAEARAREAEARERERAADRDLLREMIAALRGQAAGTPDAADEHANKKQKFT